MIQAQFTEANAVRTFATAGNARFTLVSKKTGTRFTYKVKAGTDDRFFVSVLTGSDNESDYVYIGTIFADGAFRHGSKSTIGKDAKSVQAFAFVWARIIKGELHSEVECWHEGRCGKCGKTLTVPSSIESGLGPECAKKGAASPLTIWDLPIAKRMWEKDSIEVER